MSDQRVQSGTRVRLLRCADPYTAIAPGTTGIVQFVDDTGTVHVQWDDGQSLGMIEEAGDRFSVIG